MFYLTAITVNNLIGMKMPVSAGFLPSICRPYIFNISPFQNSEFRTGGNKKVKSFFNNNILNFRYLYRLPQSHPFSALPPPQPGVPEKINIYTARWLYAPVPDIHGICAFIFICSRVRFCISVPEFPNGFASNKNP